MANPSILFPPVLSILITYQSSARLCRVGFPPSVEP
uniref:Uncharacterized protein n=1 Tax=Anguilla anguilla TaxID=7936 RepID=A0A0E9VFK4_ANGAN